MVTLQGLLENLWFNLGDSLSSGEKNYPKVNILRSLLAS